MIHDCFGTGSENLHVMPSKNTRNQFIFIISIEKAISIARLTWKIENLQMSLLGRSGFDQCQQFNIIIVLHHVETEDKIIGGQWTRH